VTGPWRKFEAFGESKALATWSRDPRSMIGYAGLRHRVLKKGMAVELALVTAPSQTPGPARNTSRDADIRRAAEAGKTIIETAVELGISRNIVHNVAKRLDVKFTTRLQRNVERDAAITGEIHRGRADRCTGEGVRHQPGADLPHRAEGRSAAATGDLRPASGWLEENSVTTEIGDIPGEEWRSIPGYEGLYEVSNYGRIKSLARTNSTGTLIVPEKIKIACLRNSYLAVRLCKNGTETNKPVHALVLLAFVGPRPADQQCRHLNGDAWDNRLINLAWGTSTENREDQRQHGTDQIGERHPKAKLTRWNVLIDIPVYTAMGLNRRQIAMKLGVNRVTIKKIVRGQTWTHLYRHTSPIFAGEIEQWYAAFRGTMEFDEP